MQLLDMTRLDVDEMERAVASKESAVRRDLRQVMLSGLALTVPFFITVLVLLWALNTIRGFLTPLADALVALQVVDGMGSIIVEAIAASLVLGTIFVVGLATQHGPDTQLARRVDVLMEDLPGIGSIYTSVERMSDVILEGDSHSFREVKVVEFPNEGSYVLAFVTADTPSEIEAAAGHDEMVTLFVPLAPNPVMGGHLVNLPRERVHDVDLTLEEGMEAVMTTGIAIDENARVESGPAAD
jgi:uncharacterized membrane protein